MCVGQSRQSLYRRIRDLNHSETSSAVGIDSEEEENIEISIVF